MLTAVLVLSALNVGLQLLAAYQRHEGLKHQRRNGCGCRHLEQAEPRNAADRRAVLGAGEGGGAVA